MAAERVVLLADRRLDVLEPARDLAHPLLAPAMLEVVAILELGPAGAAGARPHRQRLERLEELRLRPERERLREEELERLRLLPPDWRPPWIELLSPRLLRLRMLPLPLRLRERPVELRLRIELRLERVVSPSRGEGVIGFVLESEKGSGGGREAASTSRANGSRRARPARHLGMDVASRRCGSSPHAPTHLKGRLHMPNQKNQDDDQRNPQRSGNPNQGTGGQSGNPPSTAGNVRGGQQPGRPSDAGQQSGRPNQGGGTSSTQGSGTGMSKGSESSSSERGRQQPGSEGSSTSNPGAGKNPGKPGRSGNTGSDIGDEDEEEMTGGGSQSGR
jgi:hypothetical protein